MNRNTLLLAAIGVAFLLLGMFAAYKVMTYQVSIDPAKLNPPAKIPTHRPDFSLPDLQGTARHIREWDGQVVLLNFWATWCPPCLQEIPDFIELRNELGNRGFEIVGVAVDQPDKVSEFIDRLGMDYPVLVSEAKAMDIMRAYGSQRLTLPFSVLFDRSGRIIRVWPAPVSKFTLLEAVTPLL